MRLRSPIAITLLCGSLLSVGGVTFATVDPNARVELPPLDTILREWSSAMSVERPRQLHFRRYEYDGVFHLEKRSTGSFTLNRDGQARYLMVAAEIPEGAASRKTSNGVPYELTSSDSLQWYWGVSNVTMLDPGQMTAWRTPRHPKPAWFGVSVLGNPKAAFPLMLGMSEEELNTNYHWKIDENWKRRDTEIHLFGDPKIVLSDRTRARERSFNHRRMFQRVEVVLDRHTFQTQSFRLKGPVYWDDDHSIEVAYVIERIVEPSGVFWTPDLTGYKLQNGGFYFATLKKPTSEDR